MDEQQLAELDCLLASGIDYPTATEVATSEPAADPEPQALNAAHQWGVLVGVVAVLAWVLLAR